MLTKRFWLFGYTDKPFGGLSDYITESNCLTTCVHSIPFWAVNWHIWDNEKKEIILNYQEKES